MDDLHPKKYKAIHLVAALLHRFGETSITLTEGELLGESLGLYAKLELTRDPATGAVSFKLHAKPSKDPQLPL